MERKILNDMLWRLVDLKKYPSPPVNRSEYTMIMDKLIDDGFVKRTVETKGSTTTISHRLTFDGKIFIEGGGYKDMVSTNLQGMANATDDKYSKTQVAMYYYYLIKAGIRGQMGYEKNEAGKVQALTVIATQYGFSPQSFQQKFNAINNHKSTTWITGTPQNIQDFNIVIAMLVAYPQAEQLAKTDLMQAEIAGGKRGNPVI